MQTELHGYQFLPVRSTPTLLLAKLQGSALPDPAGVQLLWEDFVNVKQNAQDIYFFTVNRRVSSV